MKCPKCDKEMIAGEMGISANSSIGRSTLFWAPKEVFNRLLPNTLTAKKAVSEGGVQIKI